MSPRQSTWAVLVVFSLVLGCGQHDVAPAPPGRTVDAGIPPDAGGTDDAGSDAGVTDDAGSDAGVTDDAGSDAGVTDDAGSDAGPVAEVPSAPTDVVAVRGDASARVSWSAPEEHGSPITGYTVEASPDGVGVSVPGDVLSVQVTGLTNGRPYTFTVLATNGVGPSAPSLPSPPVTPAGLPGAPVDLVAQADVRGARLEWSAAEDHGSPITGYTVGILPPVDTASITVTGTGAEVTGLADGTPYTLTVSATNDVGTGPAATVPVLTWSAPDAPSAVVATVDDAGGVSVAWTAPGSHGGSQVTGYTVTASPGGLTLQAPAETPHVAFTGLPLGQPVTFSVVATNRVGDSVPSPASEPVTPRAPPAAPSDVVATAEVRGASVSWTAPTDHGSPITGYTVEVLPTGGGAKVSVSGTHATVTGLEDDSRYTFTVRASNAAGQGPASPPSEAVTTPDVPGAPEHLSTTAGDTAATVSWLAPSSDGGRELTAYTVTLQPGGLTRTVPASDTQVRLTDLVNGTVYEVQVVAHNAVGSGLAANGRVTPLGAPSAPTGVVATAGNARAEVSWSVPASNGGTPITGYTVTASPGGASLTVATPGAALTGLVNGQPYTFTVRATNAVGDGPGSAPSAPVTPSTVPDAPTNVTASVDVSRITVRWTAPAFDGGSPLTGQEVTARGVDGVPLASEAVAADATEVTFHTLAPGGRYTFTVVATNARGDSEPSEPSEAVALPGLPEAPQQVRATAGRGEATVSWAAPAGDGGLPLLRYTVTPLREGVPGEPLTVPAPGAEVTVRGLINGQAYVFRVTAANALGEGPAAASDPVTPVSVPDAPTEVVATAGVRSLHVTWTAPASDGGAPVTSYRVTPYAAGLAGVPVTVGAGPREATLTGLSTGTAYRVGVVAVSAVGESSESERSAEVLTADIPSEPLSPLASALGNGKATVTWTPPASNGRSPITRYTVRASPGGLTATAAGSATSATVRGLDGGTHYTFTVWATNAVGDGPPSGACEVTTSCGAGLGGWPLLKQKASSVAVADFNKDGIADLGITQYQAAAVLLGNGSGGFDLRGLYSLPTNAEGATLADFNNDGNLDMALRYGLYGSTTLSIVFGNGQGLFTSKRDFTAGNTPLDMTSADFNGDGNADLAVAHSGNQDVSLFLGNGTGGFAPRQDLPFGTTLRSVASGDLDGDGKADLVVSHGNSTVSVLLGTAAGLSARQDFTAGLYPRFARVADIDADGRLDVVVANGGDQTVGVLPGDGTGRLGPQRVSTTGLAPNEMSLADVNGDGRWDLALVSTAARMVSVLLGDGAGGFSGRQDFATLRDPSTVASGDFNGDGRTDLILSNSGQDSMTILKGDGAGTFLARRDVATGSSPTSATSADFNGDGLADLAVTSSGSNSVGVMLGDGTGRFGTRRNFAVQNSPSSVVAVDLNRDGKLDLVVANGSGTPGPTLNGNVSVWLGDGTGGFTGKKEFTTGVGPQAVISGDFNGDRLMDVVTVNSNDHTVSMLPGDGAGGLRAAQTSSVTNTPVAVASADVDGDGDLDLVVAGYGGAVEVERNSGNGYFTLASNVSLLNRPRGVALADFNGDGRVDAAVTNSNYLSTVGTTVSVLLGNGSGGLTLTQTLTVGRNPYGVTTGDFDGDGRADIVVGNYDAANSTGNAKFVSFFPGLGTGDFGPRKDFGTGGQPYAVMSADLNRDGRLDVVTSNLADGTVSLLMNLCLE